MSTFKNGDEIFLLDSDYKIMGEATIRDAEENIMTNGTQPNRFRQSLKCGFKPGDKVKVLNNQNEAYVDTKYTFVLCDGRGTDNTVLNAKIRRYDDATCWVSLDNLELIVPTTAKWVPAVGDTVRVLVNHRGYFKGQESVITWLDPPSVLNVKLKALGNGTYWVSGHNLELITSKSTTVEQKTMPVTREQMKKLHDAACSGWKTRIVDAARVIFSNPLVDEGQVAIEWLDTAWAASNPTQRQIIQGMFPEYKKDKNAFVASSTSNYQNTAIRDLDTALQSFAASAGLEGQIALNNSVRVQGREDLQKRRSIWFGKSIEVKLHPSDGGGTVLELIRK